MSKGRRQNATEGRREMERSSAVTKTTEDAATHSPPKSETRHKFGLSNKKNAKAENHCPNSKSGLNVPIFMSDLRYKLL